MSLKLSQGRSGELTAKITLGLYFTETDLKTDRLKDCINKDRVDKRVHPAVGLASNWHLQQGTILFFYCELLHDVIKQE